MRLQLKLFLLVVLSMLCVLIVFNSFFYQKSTEQDIQVIKTKLMAEADLKHEFIQYFFQSLQHEVELITSRTQLKISLNDYLNTQQQSHLDKVERILNDALQVAQKFERFRLISLDGQPLYLKGYVNFDTHAIHPLNTQDILISFFKVKDKNFIRLQAPLMFKGKQIATVQTDVSLRKLNDVISHFGRSGFITGDTVLVKYQNNGNALFLNPVKYDPQSALTRTLPASSNTTVSVMQAYHYPEGQFLSALDYRGIPVYSYVRYIQDIDIGLSVELDQSEVTDLYLQRIYQQVAFTLLIALVVIGFGYIVIRRWLVPLQAIRESMKSLAKGDFRPVTQIQGNDDLGELTQTYNEMLEAQKANIEREQAGQKRLTIDSLKLQMAAQSANIGIWQWHIATNKLIWDDQMFLIYDLPVTTDINLDTWRNRLTEQDQARTFADLKAAIENQTLFDTQFNIKISDDSERTIKASATFLLNEKGEIEWLVGTNKDITEEVRLQHHLNRINTQISLAQKQAQLGIWEDNHKTGEYYWSNEIYSLLHLNPQNYVPTQDSLNDFIHPEDALRVHTHKLSAKWKKGAKITYRLLLQDGTIKWIEEQCNTLLDEHQIPISSLGTLYDVSNIYQLSQQIEDEKHRYKKLMEMSSDAIFIMTVDTGKLIEYSHQAQKLLGYSDDEMQQLSVTDWDKNIAAEEYQALVTQIGFEPVTIERMHQRKDGSNYIAEIKAIRFKIGDEEFLSASTRDVTAERQRLQEARLAAVTFEAQEGIAITDANKRYLKVNQAYYEITGFSEDEVIGQTPRILSSGKHSQKFYQDMWACIDRDGYWKGEVINRRKDGSHFPSELVITSIKGQDNQPLYYVAFFNDITEKKQQEQALIEARQKAEQSNQAKSQFLANMSHEIRTPLNGIIGLTEIVLETPLNAKQHDYLTKSIQSSKALLNVINDILDYSKIEAGKLDLDHSEFELAPIVENIISLFQYTAERKHIQLSMQLDSSLPTSLIGDSMRLTQVLNNLVGNAIKFTNSGQVAIHIYPISQNDQQAVLRFDISDTGIGMDKETQERLFENFMQADVSNTRKYGGTGLGLAISKNLIELMQGQIFVTSQLGQGTVFSFELAFAIGHTRTPQIPQASAQTQRIALIDDSQISRQHLSALLEQHDIPYTLFASGPEALDALTQPEFHCAVIDWDMPEMNGIAVLAALNDAKYGHIKHKILMLNEHHKAPMQQEADTQGISPPTLLIKPITSDALTNALSSISALTEHRPKMAGQILVAEDNSVNQLVIQELLNSYGLEVTLVDNGLQALEMCQRKEFDLIILDIQMPVMGGIEAARHIQALNKHIPIIALSAAVMSKDRTQTQQAGMAHHLAKPIDRQELEQVLKRYLTINTHASLPTNSADSTPSIELDGIDLMTLETNLGIPAHKYYQFFKNFYENYSNVSEQLEGLEYEALRKYIHRLKGTAGNLQMNRLYQLCIEIEKQGTGTHPELIDSLQALVTQHCEQIQQRLLPLLDES